MQAEFLPKAVKNGFTKAAIINARDPHTQLSLEKVLEINDEYEAQLFKDFDAAVKWMTGQLDEKDSSPQILNERLIIRSENKYQLIPFDEIFYLQSMENGLAVHCVKNVYFTYTALKDYLSKLPSNFMQIHRSYIINIHKVNSMKHVRSGNYEVRLKGQANLSLPVSRKHAPSLKEKLNI